MTTKTDKEREAFKQELLHASSWHLRKLADKEAGIPIDEIKSVLAKENGIEALIALLMEKYDEGWRSGEPAINQPTDHAKGGTKPAKRRRKTKEPEEPEEPEEDPDDEPGNDEEDVGEEDDGGFVMYEDDVENDEEKPPTPPINEEFGPPDEEISGIEDKLDRIYDLLTDTSNLLVVLNEHSDKVFGLLREIKYDIVWSKETTFRLAKAIMDEVGVKPSKFKKVYEYGKTLAKKAVAGEKE